MIDTTRWNLHEAERPEPLSAAAIVGYSSPHFSQTPAFLEFTADGSGRVALVEADPRDLGEAGLSLHLEASIVHMPLPAGFYIAGVDRLFALKFHGRDLRLEYATEADAEARYTTLLKVVPPGVEFTAAVAVVDGELVAYAKRHDTGESKDFSVDVDAASFGSPEAWVGLDTQPALEEAGVVRVHSLTLSDGRPEGSAGAVDPNANAPLTE